MKLTLVFDTKDMKIYKIADLVTNIKYIAKQENVTHIETRINP